MTHIVQETAKQEQPCYQVWLVDRSAIWAQERADERADEGEEERELTARPLWAVLPEKLSAVDKFGEDRIAETVVAVCNYFAFGQCIAVLSE